MRTKNKKGVLTLSLIALLVSSTFISCKKDLTVDDLADFNVTTDSVAYKVGTPITFTIKGGQAHDISFYSGETLKDYNYRNGRIVDTITGGAVLAFSTSVTVGTLQADPLYVLVSTNFNGDYSNMSSVNAATWTDITSRFSLATTATFKATSADVSDLIVKGKPFYVAFKYTNQPQAVSGVVRQWQIQSLTLASKYKLDNSSILNYSDQPSAGFQLVDSNKLTAAPARSTIITTLITLLGNLYNAATPTVDPVGVNWAISTGINTDKINLGPDWSTAIKGYTSAQLNTYAYTYPKAGTYTAVFVASNNSLNESKQVVKTISLTINP